MVKCNHYDSFRIVYNVVVRNRQLRLAGEAYKCSLEVARRNKVLLDFLGRLGISDHLIVREEEKYRLFLASLQEVSEVLEGEDFIFIKMYKPVRYVPSDIDVLVARDKLASVARKLMRIGYIVEVVEPYTLTLVRKNRVIDLYVHPSLAGVVYMDGNSLLWRRERVSFNSSIKIPSLSKGAEAALTAAHAIYKEKLYTLNDYITISRWADGETLQVCRENYCTDALRTALYINRKVDEGLVSLPYKIPTVKWAGMLLSKIVNDPLTRSTLPRMLYAVADRRFGKLLIDKFRRLSY